MVKISAIIMASGFSKRMGTNKLFLEYQGRTFLEHILLLSKKLGFFEQILVISPENLAGISLPEGVKVVLNHEADQGQSTSVRLGTQFASGDGYLYLTVDQPLLDEHLFVPLLAAYTTDNIVFPVTVKGNPSSPIFFGKRFRADLLQVTGSSGGREVRNKYPDTWQRVPVSEPYRLADIDTYSDYQKLIANKVDERTRS
ncbi:NTP transferase domain-containing protein [Enterococcus wangshanyuanii]|uniref:Molybdenum cofactor cytidylyltransferase n=1 Tax=Enterococcus wangshanyuanii TaxID=2005703 RepID=A0ABQ1NNQ6_9ENTE|nr:NTP transferase domain-containing protein [Enterococcus wangshanyuanii]GGC78835.1 molybdenum cofactor cytidylyltransferase [Enterococcus wangshanyuanii]